MKSRITLVGKRDRQFFYIFFAILFAMLLSTTFYTRFNPFEIIMRAEAFWIFLNEDFIPPAIANPAAVMQAIAVTFAMAIISTFIAMFLAFFSAVFASTRTAPAPRLAKYVRAVVTMIRNIPSLIWALILFSALGIGAGVAVIALVISSYGFLTRTFTEVIDELPSDALEPLTACGCTFGQKVFHCVLPNCIIGLMEWFLFSFEINIRSTTIVGMVGGGGIGLVLFRFIRSFNYQAAAGIILIIALMVIVVELFMNILRKKLLVFR